MKARLLAVLLVFFGLAGAAEAQVCGSLPFILTNGTLADATQVMANFGALLTCANTLLAPKASPIFTGTPQVPTAPAGTNTTQIASTAFVESAINAAIPVANTTALKAQATTAGACFVRQSFAVAGDAPPLTYCHAAIPTPCSINAGAGDNGSQVSSLDGKCWLAVFPTSGIDMRQFGADATGVADSTNAVNAALALCSNHKFVFAPGTYLIGSNHNVSPYPLITGQFGFYMLGTSGAHCHDVDIAGEGAIIMAANGSNNSNWFVFDYIDNFSIHGFTIVGNHTGIGPSNEPSAFALFHATRGVVRDIKLPSGWDGGLSVFMAGNILTDVTIDNIDMPAQAQCFDVAWLTRVSFSNIKVVGSGSSGASEGVQCFGISYDVAATTDYPTAFPSSSTTSHVSIANTVDVSNFISGGNIQSGNFYSIQGNFHDNTGAPGSSGLNILNINTTCCSSSIDPIHDVTLSGNFSTNGTGGASAGIVINGTGVGVGTISNIMIDGATFNNNNPLAVTTSSTGVSNIVIGANMLIPGANQNVQAYDNNTLTNLGRGTLRTDYGASCPNSLVPATALTQWCGIGAGFGQAENQNTVLNMTAGLLNNFQITANVAPGVGHSFTATVRVNAISTAITCQITGLNTFCTDSTHTALVGANVNWDIQVTADAAGAATATYFWGLNKYSP